MSDENNSPKSRRFFLKGTLSGLAVGSLLTEGLRRFSKKESLLTDASPSHSNTSPHKESVNKVALVTGGARGIGRACALDLARNGVDIALLDIANPRGVKSVSGYDLSSPRDLDETTEQIQQLGRKVLRLPIDVRNVDEMSLISSKILSQMGRLDILVACAGVSVIKPFVETSNEEWQAVIDVNLTGVANSIRAVLPPMQKQKSGRIVVISSMLGRMGSPNLASYVASKWGLIGLVKSLALEQGPNNILVNAVAPSGVNTEMFGSAGQLKAAKTTKATQELFLRKINPLPVGILEPEDIARAVTFLSLSESSAGMTGSVFDIAGGANAYNLG